MANRSILPAAFDRRAFSRAEALEAGITDRVLRGPRCVAIAPGWYRYADTEPTPELMARAGVGWLGDGCGLSHVTNLAWRGLQMRPSHPVHLATRRRIDRRVDGFSVHRFLGPLDLEPVRGLPLVGAERTFVDCGTMLSVTELVMVGDWLVTQHLSTPFDLRGFVHEVHYDGVQRARRAAELVRRGSESPQESRLRVTLVRFGLPEPEINGTILDRYGGFLARGDLIYRAERVLVEYDGWHHERDARQRLHDLSRRERLEAEGWRVIVVTDLDMRNPTLVVRRVAEALGRARFAPRTTFEHQ